MEADWCESEMLRLTLVLSGISCYLFYPVDNLKCWNLTLKLTSIMLAINSL